MKKKLNKQLVSVNQNTINSLKSLLAVDHAIENEVFI